MAGVDEQLIFDGAHLRAMLAGPGPNGLFVNFDNWRKDRAGFPERAPLKIAQAMGYASLNIATAANDWFLNRDLDPLRRVLAGLAPRYPVVRAMGFSMGGYGALLFSGALRLDYVTLFAPQVSIRAKVAPFERRWRREAGLIDERLDDLAGIVSPDLKGVAIFDPFYARAERLHARAIQALAPGIALAPMPFSRHPPTAVIMANARFRDIQRAAIAGNLTAGDIRQVHRTGRQGSEVYLQGMLAALRARGGPDS
jgi:hypothetical protein